MKMRTLLALVLFGLLAVGGCQKAREVKPEEGESENKRKVKAKPGEPEQIGFLPSVEPNKEPAAERIGSPRIEEVLEQPEVEKGEKQAP